MTKEINRVKPEQVYIIADLEKDSFTNPWSSMMIEEDMMHDFSEFWVLKVDGINVGYANIWIIDNSIELNRICIKKDFRNNGYADILINHIIGIMQENDLDRIILEVADDNKAALGLYNKFKFKDIHRRNKYYENGADALIKELRLNDI